MGIVPGVQRVQALPVLMYVDLAASKPFGKDVFRARGHGRPFPRATTDEIQASPDNQTPDDDHANPHGSPPPPSGIGVPHALAAFPADSAAVIYLPR